MIQNILLADDHVIIMDGLKALIREILPDAQIAQATDMAATLQHLSQTETQVAICDINMPGANHFGMVKAIKAIQPDIRILIFTAYSSWLYANRYLLEGADAYLNKNADASVIGKTIQALLSHDTDTPLQLNGIDSLEQSPLQHLSNRELEVAQLLVQGKGILEIARLLGLHMNTISTYKTRILEKMDVLSVTELVPFFPQLY